MIAFGLQDGTDSLLEGICKCVTMVLFAGNPSTANIAKTGILSCVIPSVVVVIVSVVVSFVVRGASIIASTVVSTVVSSPVSAVVSTKRLL